MALQDFTNTQSTGTSVSQKYCVHLFCQSHCNQSTYPLHQGPQFSHHPLTANQLLPCCACDYISALVTLEGCTSSQCGTRIDYSSRRRLQRGCSFFYPAGKSLSGVEGFKPGSRTPAPQAQITSCVCCLWCFVNSS